MAVGDVVSATYAGANNFQPAVGIECIILHANLVGGAGNFGLTDGVNVGAQYMGNWQNVNNFGLGGMLIARIPINNTVYFTSTTSGGYSGIQIK